VIVDTAVQPKNMTCPTDAKLLNRVREKLVRLAKLQAVALRQSYVQVGKLALNTPAMFRYTASAITRCSRRMRAVPASSRPISRE
jgi:transposase, IS5 family